MSDRTLSPLPILALAAALCLAQYGCTPALARRAAPSPDVPLGRTRHVDVLDLESMSQDEQAEPEGAASEPSAPAELELSLAECRATALENNLALKVQLISPAMSAEAVEEAIAVFEPSLFADASYSRSETPSGTHPRETVMKSASADAGLEIPLLTGGSLTVGVPLSRTETEGAGAVDQVYATQVGVTVSQPLLRDAGVRASTYGIRIAQYESKISEAQTKLELMRVIAAVDRVYWRLHAARRELQVRKEEHNLAVAQLDRARRMVDAGVLPEVEIIRAETGVAERTEAIIVADNAVRDRERELKRVLNGPGLGVRTPTIVVPVTEPDPRDYTLSLDRLTEAALENRMEMLELELRLAQDAVTVDFRRNQKLPSLAVSYTYGINGLGPAAHDAYDLMFERRYEDHSVGAQLVVPLGNRAAEARLRQALYTKAQTLASRDRRVVEIEQEVASALDQLESNWHRVVAARQRTTLARRNLDAEERQFGQGLRTSTEVLEAQTRLADAWSALIRAETEYEISKVDLAFATGFLLGEAAIQWEPIVPVAP
jgi:outer membrane protein